MPSSIESVASFSIVLGEAFAAVGLSTLVPNTFIALTKAAKGGGAAISDVMLTNAKIPGAVEAAALMRGAAASLDSMDILLPKDAKIHAEFEFQGSDKMSADVSVGGQVEVVTVKAGFSAMYESKSSNKITLDVNFVTVHVGLETPVAPSAPATTVALVKPTGIKGKPVPGGGKIIVWNAVPGATQYVVSINSVDQAAVTDAFFAVPTTITTFTNVTVEAQNAAGASAKSDVVANLSFA